MRERERERERERLSISPNLTDNVDVVKLDAFTRI
jgi:hypothetical protein